LKKAVADSISTLQLRLGAPEQTMILPAGAWHIYQCAKQLIVISLGSYTGSNFLETLLQLIPTWPARLEALRSAEPGTTYSHGPRSMDLASALLQAPFSQALRELDLSHSIISTAAADALLSGLPALTHAALGVRGTEDEPWSPAVPPRLASLQLSNGKQTGSMWMSKPLPIDTSALAAATALQGLKLRGNLHLHSYTSLGQLTALTSLWLDHASDDLQAAAREEAEQQLEQAQAAADALHQQVSDRVRVVSDLESDLSHLQWRRNDYDDEEPCAGAEAEAAAQLDADMVKVRQQLAQARAAMHELFEPLSAAREQQSAAEQACFDAEQQLKERRWRLLAQLPRLQSYTAAELQVPACMATEPLQQLTALRARMCLPHVRSRHQKCCLARALPQLRELHCEGLRPRSWGQSSGARSSEMVEALAGHTQLRVLHTDPQENPVQHGLAWSEGQLQRLPALEELCLQYGGIGPELRSMRQPAQAAPAPAALLPHHTRAVQLLRDLAGCSRLRHLQLTTAQPFRLHEAVALTAGQCTRLTTISLATISREGPAGDDRNHSSGISLAAVAHLLDSGRLPWLQALKLGAGVYSKPDKVMWDVREAQQGAAGGASDGQLLELVAAMPGSCGLLQQLLEAAGRQVEAARRQQGYFEAEAASAAAGQAALAAQAAVEGRLARMAAQGLPAGGGPAEQGRQQAAGQQQQGQQAEEAGGQCAVLLQQLRDALQLHTQLAVLFGECNYDRFGIVIAREEAEALHVQVMYKGVQVVVRLGHVV
jgi:hypothetical protein